MSRGARFVRETIKKGCVRLSAKVLRSFSYPVFAIPSGLTHVDESVEELYPAKKLKVLLPKTIKEPLSHFTKEEILSADGIFMLKGGIATGLGGNLLSNGKLITTYLQPLDGKPPHLHDIFRFTTRRFFPRIYETNENVITLAAGWQGAFYHWMYDVLPRLHLVEKKGLSGRLFIEANTSFQKESLQLMGILEEEIINIRDFEAVKAGTIFVPSISPWPTPWGCQFLRERFLPKLKKTKKKRVYVSRNDASRRRILNEEEVFRILDTLGFEKVVLSPMNLKEQMEVFYNAEVIVGPHGAGFSHLAFCDPQTPVLEIFSPKYINPCYWHVSNRVNLDYFYLLGKETIDHANPKDPDIDVDLEELKASLRLMDLL